LITFLLETIYDLWTLIKFDEGSFFIVSFKEPREIIFSFFKTKTMYSLKLSI
jgi:hypothetical protein